MFEVDKNGEILYPFVRSPYNYDMARVSRETALICDVETRAKQEFKDECDINILMRQFGVTGNMPIAAVAPTVGDFTVIDDYHTALNTIIAADENFLRLPSAIRERFNNSPQQFVDFCIDPANIEAVRDLNLAPRPAAPALPEVIKDGSS